MSEVFDDTGAQAAEQSPDNVPDQSTEKVLAESQQASDEQCVCAKPCECLGSYDVNIKIITRLCGKPLRNVSVSIVGLDEAGTDTGDEELIFPESNTLAQGRSGNDGRFQARSINADYLEIWAKYENAAEKLRKEVVKLTLGRLKPNCVALASLANGNRVVNQIWKIHDVKEETNDVNFIEKRDIISAPSAASGGDKEGEESANFIERTSRAAGNSQQIFDTEIKAVYKAAAGKDGRLRLEITLVMDTFSLRVPYLNQNMSSVIVFSYTPPREIAGGRKIMFSFPSQVRTSIVQGGRDPDPTSIANLNSNGWAIDAGEQDHVYNQLEPYLPRMVRQPTDWNHTPSFGSATGYQALSSTMAVEVDRTSICGLFNFAWERVHPPRMPHSVHSKDCVSAYQPHLRAGSDLCASTSAVMLMLYHGYETDNIPRLRSDLMRKSYELATNNFASWQGVLNYNEGGYTKPWQTNGHLSNAMSALINEHGQMDGCSGRTLSADYLPLLRRGLPSTASVSSHVMVIRGAVIDASGEVVWTICNDPQGTLAGPDSDYDVQSGFKTTEQEINLFGLGSDDSRTRGRHVYYKTDLTHRKKAEKVSFSGRFYIEKTGLDLTEKLIPSN
ncbi:hypothetical protein C4J81_06920 [Deltaproteobacteria bacterium Smac51]|nr:hypothetical protein C4J81_06920 [Deltaproteobacteria bacterium Smac51]